MLWNKVASIDEPHWGDENCVAVIVAYDHQIIVTGTGGHHKFVCLVRVSLARGRCEDGCITMVGARIPWLAAWKRIVTGVIGGENRDV